ncbi:MAG TPA: polyprenyl synthetase family protein [Terriglobales bacterium]|nr:polyprenyl synthetase family protein [Terriglobales bacterium]
MSIAAVQRPVRRELAQVQELLREAFRTSIPILNKVGGHVLATRGKKLRPTLLLLTARARGRLDQAAILSAAAIEMVHAAALIHDDSVDRSVLRRGLPTVNGLWTDEMAIIMGDYLFAHAVGLLVRHRLECTLEVLSRVATDMACGEALEFQYAYDLDVTEERYLELARAKTGSLMGAATEIGSGGEAGRARAPGAGVAPRRGARVLFREFGERLGVAFQIVDDLFDYLGDPEVMGKPVGSDLAEGKVTLPLIAALREASESDRRRLKQLALRKRWTAGQWQGLRRLIEKCGGFEYARARSHALAQESRCLLERALGPITARPAPAIAAARALDRAVDYAVRRDR